MKRRKNKNFSRRQEAKASFRHEVSVGNVKLLASGLLMLIGAFFVLRLANSHGNNFAAGAAPFVFIFSWALILTGILWENEKQDAEKNDK